jgi:hypothetical protein
LIGHFAQDGLKLAGIDGVSLHDGFDDGIRQNFRKRGLAKADVHRILLAL